MRSEIISSGQEERSFIETARRAQIVDCAIDAIAELGYPKASLAEIARRAGVSKGVISYHFAGKRELIEEVVRAVMEKATSVMLPRIFAERSASGMLRTYIESNLDFVSSNPKYMHALMNIGAGARADDNGPVIDFTVAFDPAVRELEKLLRYGQERSEFREFSPHVMAVTIRSAIDAVVLRFELNPKLDLKSYAIELAHLFDLATRKSP